MRTEKYNRIKYIKWCQRDLKFRPEKLKLIYFKIVSTDCWRQLQLGLGRGIYVNWIPCMHFSPIYVACIVPHRLGVKQAKSGCENDLYWYWYLIRRGLKTFFSEISWNSKVFRNNFWCWFVKYKNAQGLWFFDF